MSDFKLTDSKEQITIDAAKTLIINLKVLGILTKESKLISRGKFLIIDPITWYQPFVRKFYHNDGRSFTYDKISSIMKELYFLLEKQDSYKYLKLSSKKEMNEYLLPILNDAKNGLILLKETYIDDKTFVSQLDVEICNFEMILKNIHNEFKVSDPIPIPTNTLLQSPLQNSIQSPLQSSMQSPLQIPLQSSLQIPLQPSYNLNSDKLSENFESDRLSDKLNEIFEGEHVEDKLDLNDGWE